MKRLFITFEALGDAVMRCGVLRVLARDAIVDLGGRPYLSIYGDCPWIRRTLDLRPLLRHRHPWCDRVIAGRRELTARLQAAEYDEVVCYQRDADRGLRRWLRHRLPNVRLREIPRDCGQHSGHVTEQGASMLTGLGIAADGFDPVPALPLSGERLATGVQRLSSLGGPRAVCFQPGSALATTPWWDLRRRRMGNPKALPAATWSSLAEALLLRDAASGIVLLGSPGEYTLAASIREGVAASLRPRVHLAAVGLPVPEMAAVVRASALLITVDTGPAHVAAAVGAQVLAIFGPTDPARFAPRGPGRVRTVVGDIACRPCHGTPAAKRCHDNRCLRLLPGERLVSEALRCLSPTATAMST